MSTSCQSAPALPPTLADLPRRVFQHFPDLSPATAKVYLALYLQLSARDFSVPTPIPAFARAISLSPRTCHYALRRLTALGLIRPLPRTPGDPTITYLLISSPPPSQAPLQSAAPQVATPLQPVAPRPPSTLQPSAVSRPTLQPVAPPPATTLQPVAPRAPQNPRPASKTATLQPSAASSNQTPPPANNDILELSPIPDNILELSHDQIATLYHSLAPDQQALLIARAQATLARLDATEAMRGG